MRPNGKPDLAAFLVGLSSLWVQVVLIRRLFAVFSGNELTIGLVIAAWMIWTGLGTWLPAKASDRIEKPENALALVFVLIAVLLVPSVLLTPLLKTMLGISMAEVAGLPAIAVSSFIVTAPVCFLLGFAFNLAARMQKRSGTEASRAYRFEALGAVTAGAILAFWFSGRATPTTPAVVMAVILLTGGMVMPDRERSGKYGILLAAELLVLLVLIATGHINKKGNLDDVYEKLYWRGMDVIESLDSRHGYLAAVKQGDEVTLYKDGMPAATFPDPASSEALAHLPAIMAPPGSKALVIGGGLSNMARELVKHPFGSVSYTTTDPEALMIEQTYAPGDRPRPGTPPVEVIERDGRLLLKEKLGKYGLIIVNLPDPYTAGLDRFYTRQFFELAKDSLEEAGVLAFTAGTTPDNMAYTASQIGLLAGAMKTARSVFPKVEVLPLSENIIVAGNEKTDLFTDAIKIGEALQQRGIETFYASPEMLSSDLHPYRIEQVGDRIAGTGARINTDMRPSGYLYGIMGWAERASPKAAELARKVAGLPGWSLLMLPAIFMAASLAAFRQGPGRASAALLAAVSGLAGITNEVAASIAYQMAVGSVYFALSLLTASFMVGLALGAWTWERRGKTTGLFPAAVFLVCGTALCLLCIWITLTAGAGKVMATMLLCGALLVQGAASGTAFPAAAKRAIAGREQVGAGVGLINGAEHLGGALGGVLAGTLLVPVYGIAGAALTSLITAIVILPAALGKRKIKRGENGTG